MCSTIIPTQLPLLRKEKMATGESGSAEVTYEELAELEYEFDEVDLQIST